MKARIDALTNQINPHFLFNTLASISSLVRTKPETARMLILKLSNMLRRRLRHDEPFVSLREELASVDEYLDIEVVRFGAAAHDREGAQPRHARRPRPEHDPAAAGRELHQARHRAEGRRRPHHPAQPARERTGRSSKWKIMVWACPTSGSTRCSTALTANGGGIGLRNVDERLRVIYGDQCRPAADERARPRHRGAHRNPRSRRGRRSARS